MSLELAQRSLRGLSVGDAYGQRRGEMLFFNVSEDFRPGQWRWTDDTHMAISIVEALAHRGEIEQDQLAKRFAERHFVEPNRGYAGQAAMLLDSVWKGMHWSEANVSNFPNGSYGNGGAMRSAPLGAFFAGDPKKTAEQATLASEITHAHPEGIAGGIAVAVAASLNATQPDLTPEQFIDAVTEYTPDSITRTKMLNAKNFQPDDLIDAVMELGAGESISSQDTVPFCLYIVSHYRGQFEKALDETASVGGDCDTTCAIVGGILSAGECEIPREWLERTEDVPEF